ncbi:MAG TPA: peptidase M61, partial [Acetobacteraceae bacterium]|nr:peptidase M61 [Acetobacteraceae bacterium]
MTGCLRLLAIVALAATPALAAGPEPAPLPPPIMAPADKPYPGEITLSVDATDLDHHVFRMHETVPVSGAGPLTLLYPKWIPGDHGPTGPLPTLAGLVVRAGGQVLAWQRDVV